MNLLSPTCPYCQAKCFIYGNNSPPGRESWECPNHINRVIVVTIPPSSYFYYFYFDYKESLHWLECHAHLPIPAWISKSTPNGNQIVIEFDSVPTNLTPENIVQKMPTLLVFS